MTLANNHARYADNELVAAQYFAGVVSTGALEMQTGKPERVREDSSFKCKRCLGVARFICIQSNADGELLESVDSCFLGDRLSAGSAYEPAVIIRGRTVWGKYRNLLPILASRVSTTFIRPNSRFFKAFFKVFQRFSRFFSTRFLTFFQPTYPRKCEISLIWLNFRCKYGWLCLMHGLAVRSKSPIN